MSTFKWRLGFGLTLMLALLAASDVMSSDTVRVTGGSYSVGCTAMFSATTGTINNGQTGCVRHTSSASHSTETRTALTVGGVSVAFTRITVAVSSENGGGGGALAPLLLLPLLLAALRRRVGLLAAAMLALNCANPAWADSSLTLAFMPDPAQSTELISPEGCYLQRDEAQGTLAPPAEGGTCHSGLMGSNGVPGLSGNPEELQLHATFTSAPFEHGLDLAGSASVVVHLSSMANCGYGFFLGWISFELFEVRPDGSVTLIRGDGTSNFTQGCSGLGQPGATGTTNVGAYSLAPGSRLQVVLWYNGEERPQSLLFGGDSLLGPEGTSGGGSYGDSGITLTTRDPGPHTLANNVFGGAFNAGLLVALLIGSMTRRRG